MDPLSIARALREVSQYLQLKGDDFYKSRAYDLGADRMAGFSGDPAGATVDTCQSGSVSFTARRE